MINYICREFGSACNCPINNFPIDRDQIQKDGIIQSHFPKGIKRQYS
jgi:hypothetical protein